MFYLVTGATGNVGREVVSRLLADGAKVRVFTRDPGKAARWGDRVQLATGDFTDPDSFEHAIAGAQGVFLMNGGPDAASFRRLVAAAKVWGDPRIVFLSTILAGVPDSKMGQLHKDREDAIRESGLPGKFVRPGGFMTNAFQWIGTIKAEGAVHNAMGNGKFAPIAPEDIAAVVVEALKAPNYPDEVFELTGRELLSVPEQVGILARVLGKPIRCVDVPVETAIQGLIRAGVPAQMAAAAGQSFEAVRDGRAAIVRDTVETMTRRPPKTFEAWAREHASHFA
jgi:uncharacterized protein YbjT (DUF2867 family)